MIKAIETVYNGYLFRSRLEARWAVFFDSLGIKYDYEPEGFDLGNAGYYLPDFLIDNGECECYIEIKPKKLSKIEIAKLQALDNSLINPGDPLYATSLVGTPNYDIINNEFIYICILNCKSEKLFRFAVSCARQARFEHGQVGAPSQWRKK